LIQKTSKTATAGWIFRGPLLPVDFQYCPDLNKGLTFSVPLSTVLDTRVPVLNGMKAGSFVLE
jgi:hypothetical protein